MTNRFKIIVLILLLLIASQIILVKLVASGKFNDYLSLRLAKIYNLKAAEVKDSKWTYTIKLADYLENKLVLQSNLQAQENKENFNISELAWQRTLKNYWLEHFSKEYELIVSEEEINNYAASLVGADENLADFFQNNYQLSLAKAKELIIRPYLLEVKVYAYLLENYNDQEGIWTAQKAYKELELGRDFDVVAQEFSAENYSSEILWLKAEDLVYYYEPIADLRPGEFSKIVLTPNGYVIWKVQAITEDETGKVWQVKSLFVPARPFEDFFQDYVNKAKIDKKI